MNQWWQIALLSSVGLATIFIIANLWQGWLWVNQPFPGFLHRNQVVSISVLPGWSAVDKGIDMGDIIQTIDGETATSLSFTPSTELSNTPISYKFEKPDQTQVTIRLAQTTFSLGNFAQWLLIPGFLGLIHLGFITILSYTIPQTPAIKLYGILTILLSFAFISFPELTQGTQFYLTLYTSSVGAILMPPVLLHFLLFYPYPRIVLRDWPWLLPLIYLPVLPGLIQIANLLESPEILRNSDEILDLYTAIYGLAGLGLIFQALWKGNFPKRKRATVLLAGFIIPTSFFVLQILKAFGLSSVLLTPVYQLADRYVLWSIAVAAAFSIIRYDVFGASRVSHKHILFIATLSGLLGLSLLLFGFASPLPIGFNRLGQIDYLYIILTIAIFYLCRYLVQRLIRWWSTRYSVYRLEDFRTNTRILSHELLKISTRRDLEELISWNLATDFGLQSAEISTRNTPNMPYSMELPLAIQNTSLGTLYLGPKINGEVFSEQEKAIFESALQQIALTLLSVELDDAIQVTEQLTRLKSKFLANVTHELRTPLNGIINYIGFTLDDAQTLNDEQMMYLKQAFDGAEKLLDLINNILDMSKIEAGQMQLMSHPVDLRQMIFDLTPIIHDLIGEKRVQFITEVSPTLPIFQADQHRIRQILLNVLSNAIKFTLKGWVELTASQRNGDVIIKIADTGPGIDQNTLPTIFEQFATNNLTDQIKTTGPGLGLPITKSLVEMHRGEILVDSQPNVGTTFTITLPLEKIYQN